MDLLAKRDQAAALVRTGLAKGPDQETLLALSLAVEMDLQESGPAVQALLLHPNPRIRCRPPCAWAAWVTAKPGRRWSGFWPGSRTNPWPGP